jgi:hypothetical protein
MASACPAAQISGLAASRLIAGQVEAEYGRPRRNCGQVRKPSDSET